MKYMVKVILTNFQSHKYSEIEFDNGLNIVVGPSDSGKTAILRGIRWALFNEPSGDYFIREGESECSVEIVFNEGTRVKRYRSKSKNIYYLYDSLNNEIKFEGFGTNVPDEIINATGIKKILLDSDTSISINLSEQLEGAFLLSERTSTRANSIGRLVGVNIIDDALRESLRDIRNLSNNKKNVDDKIVELEDELLNYNYLDELVSNVNSLESIRNNIHEKNELLSIYKNLLAKHRSVFVEKETLNNSLKELKNIDNLIQLYSNISNRIELYNSLTKHNNLLKSILINKDICTKIISSLGNINRAEQNYGKINELNRITAELEKYQSKYKAVKSEKENLINIANKLRPIYEIRGIIDKLNIIMNNLTRLQSIRQREVTIKKRLAIGINYVERFKLIDSINDIYRNLGDKCNRLHILNSLWKDYSHKKLEIEKTAIESKSHRDEIEKYLGKYKELLLKLEVCPLCFSTIDNDKIGHIISHYN